MACVCDWVVTLVGGHLDTLALLARQNVVRTIALVVDVFCAHQRTHPTVFIVLRQLVAPSSMIVVQIEQVVGRTALILLTRIELCLFHVEDLSVANISVLHVLESADFSLVALFSQVGPSVLHVFELLLAHALVRHREVLIETLLLYNVSIHPRLELKSTTSR